MNAKVGDIVELRGRLWRLDSIEDSVIAATNIEGGEIEQRRFFLPFETVQGQVSSFLIPRSSATRPPTSSLSKPIAIRCSTALLLY